MLTYGNRAYGITLFNVALSGTDWLLLRHDENYSKEDYFEWKSDGDVSMNNVDKDQMHNNAFHVFDDL